MPAWLSAFVLLFPEEVEAVRQKATEALARSERFAPWSAQRMEAVQALVAAGRLRDAGPVCALAPTLEDVLDANAPTTPRLSLELGCDSPPGDCALRATLDLRTDPSAMRAWTVAVAEDSLDRWLGAATRLAPTDPMGFGGLGLSGGGPPPVVRAAVLHSRGVFASTDDAMAWHGPERDLVACHDASPSRTEDVDVWPLLALGHQGNVTRCAPREALTGAEARAGECFCKALGHANFSAGSGARRVLLTVVDYGPTAPQLKTPEGEFAPKLDPANVDDPGKQGLGRALESSRALKECVVKRGKTPSTTAEITVDLDEGGHVTRGAAKASEPALQACLTKALPKLALSCSADGRSHVSHAVLTLATYGPLGPKKTK
jgi:hypothetical protein